MTPASKNEGTRPLELSVDLSRLGEEFSQIHASEKERKEKKSRVSVLTAQSTHRWIRRVTDSLTD